MRELGKKQNRCRRLKATNKITKTALVTLDCSDAELVNIYKSQLKITEENIATDIPENMISTNYKSNNINITYYIEQETVDTKALEEEIKKLEASIARRKGLLSNENYVNKAPANIVETTRRKKSSICWKWQKNSKRTRTVKSLTERS